MRINTRAVSHRHNGLYRLTRAASTGHRDGAVRQRGTRRFWSVEFGVWMVAAVSSGVPVASVQLAVAPPTPLSQAPTSVPTPAPTQTPLPTGAAVLAPTIIPAPAVGTFDGALQVKNGSEATKERALAVAYQVGRAALSNGDFESAIDKLAASRRLRLTTRAATIHTTSSTPTFRRATRSPARRSAPKRLATFSTLAL